MADMGYRMNKMADTVSDMVKKTANARHWIFNKMGGGTASEVINTTVSKRLKKMHDEVSGPLIRRLMQFHNKCQTVIKTAETVMDH